MWSVHNCVSDEPVFRNGQESAAKSSGISAMASANKTVYVVRISTHEVVEANAADSLERMRHLPVPGLGSVIRGMAACTVSRVLYISDYENDVIHKVGLPNFDQDQDAVCGYFSRDWQSVADDECRRGGC